MEIELRPEQPVEIERAIAGLLTAAGQPPDPWWRAGLAEALEGDPTRQGEATGRPRSSFGAARA